MVTIADVEAAARRLDGVAVETPLFGHEVLDECAGGRVLLKAECLQRTGSFKIRGAYNRLARLSPSEAARGVVAWSSGNHAQGVASAARLLGIHAAIVMPGDAPRAKLDNTRRLGGEVITYDRLSGDREAIAREIASTRAAALVPSYDHEDVIAGQGTVGTEIVAQATALGCVADQVLVCCSGGGLTAGIAVAVKASWPACGIVAVEPEAFDDTARSLAAGRRESVPPGAASICDALQTATPGELTFPINLALGVTAVTVSDAEVREAMRFAFRHLKLVVEPGGAAALAAVLAGKAATAGRTSVVVLSGGNVDPEFYGAVQAELA
ncbi:MAG TPA: threonine/serine dehydratase [Woeseiaceae bacterium]|nr:threonine/serine dehydratase [Woeseiaceae bacterium]